MSGPMVGIFVDGRPEAGTGVPVDLVDPATGEAFTSLRAGVGGRRRPRPWLRGGRLPRLGSPHRRRPGDGAGRRRRRARGGRRPRRPGGAGDRQAPTGVRRRRAALRCRQPAVLRRCGAVPRRVRGRAADLGLHLALVKRPVGVVAGIAPWNFPFIMAIWKLGPGARGWQHHGAQAGAGDAVLDAEARRGRARCGAARRGAERRDRAAARSAPRSSSTLRSPWSRSPAPPAPAGR